MEMPKTEGKRERKGKVWAREREREVERFRLMD